MKGNQGLEALAALCGGAAKVTEFHNAPGPCAAAPAATEPPAPAPVMAAQAPDNVDDVATSRVPAQPGPQTHMAQQQQWAHHAMAAAAASTLAATPAAAVSAILQAALQPHQTHSALAQDASSTATAQQLAYFHYVQAQAAAAAQAAQMAQQQQPHNVATAPAPSANQMTDPNTAVALALTAHSQPVHGHTAAGVTAQAPLAPHQQAPLSSATGHVNNVASTNHGMQPPPPQVPTAAAPQVVSCHGNLPHVSPSPLIPAGVRPAATSVVPIAAAAPVAPASPRSSVSAAPSLDPQPLARRPSADSSDPGSAASCIASTLEDKKLLKRAANRRSAQLSRKRKKQFIEELKEENDKLRRKEQILRSIPDLIVVFDSAGRLWFVSHSVKRFLDFGPTELEGCSFWDRLCDESVRLLKAAFMDALAARSKDSDTVPLGSGVWELRLVDRDGSHKLVTLNGVVHFSGEAPECVCSIRPRETCENHLRPVQEHTQHKKARISASLAAGDVHFASTKSSSAPDVHFQANLVRDAIKPQQSVISNGSDDSSIKIVRGKATRNAVSGGAQISDNESVVSE